MIDAFLKVLPVLLTFLLGYVLKKTKFFEPEDGGLLLKLVFFVGSPALTYLAISTLDITPNLLIFPLISALVMFTVYFADRVISRNFSVPQTTVGVYFIGTLIANTGFALPFLLATYGEDAAAMVAMYDLAGGFLTYVFVYSIAVQHGDHRPSNKFILQKILIAPPVWGLILGLIANFSGFETPVIITQLLKNLGNIVSPLIMLALGLYFSPKLLHPKMISLALLTRMGGGMMLGYVLSTLFGLTGIEKAIAIICAGAPIGFNTLTFANMEKLDVKFATSLVSTGIAIGLIVVPLLTFVLSS